MLHVLHEPHIYAHITDRMLRKRNNRNGFAENIEHKETRILKSHLYLLKKKSLHFEQYLIRQKQYLIKLATASHGKAIPSIFTDNKLSLNGFMFPILIKEADRLVVDFKNKGYELGRHFSKSIDWGIACGYKMRTCPKAELVVKNVLVFPCHYNYKIINIRKMIKLYESLD